MITGGYHEKTQFYQTFFILYGIITIPIITLCFIFMAVIVYRKQQDIETEAIKSAQAVRDNYSLVLDSAATQYELLARNPRMSISLRNYISHKQIGYLDVSHHSILSNFASLTNPCLLHCFGLLLSGRLRFPPYLQYRRPHQSGPVLRFKLAALLCRIRSE